MAKYKNEYANLSEPEQFGVVVSTLKLTHSLTHSNRSVGRSVGQSVGLIEAYYTAKLHTVCLYRYNKDKKGILPSVL